MKRSLLGTGDITVDWMIARIQDNPDETARAAAWHSVGGTRACPEPGGAELLLRLMKAIVGLQENADDFTLSGPDLSGRRYYSPSYSMLCRSYTVWMPFPREAGGEKGWSWRVAEFCVPEEAQREPTRPFVAEAPADPNVIMIDDADLGFRESPEMWPAALDDPENGPDTILLKMCHPIASGELWHHLADKFSERLLLLASLSDVRRAGVQTGYDLSWEQLAEAMVPAIREHPQMSRASAVVVAMETMGGVVIERDGPAHLIFDPVNLGDAWLKQYPGMMMGYTTCMAGAIGREVLLDRDRNPDLLDAATRGVHATRVLHQVGYGTLRGEPKVSDLQFPAREIAEALEVDQQELGVVTVDEPSPDWTILEEKLAGDIMDLARRVFHDGPQGALGAVPVQQIGGWCSLDRREIESMRGLGRIIADYASDRSADKPLCIAVFGRPGSGKSFAIRQLADELLSDDVETIKFNLSQASHHSELVPVFHQIRDAVVRAKLPLVFWDEFDARYEGVDLGWLSQFLVPMEDGEFREDGFMHPLGRAMFIFAGATSHSMDEFRRPVFPEEGSAAEAMRALKAPDFYSRLHGYVDVLGPNPQDEEDRYFRLRRALLLRSLLRSRAPNIEVSRDDSIEESLLRAFLDVEEYRHGARSMRCIIDMSRLSGRDTFDCSCLPPPNQLGLHVNAC
ncbi:MAG: ATP-binding protein, partial [Armatimonadota bacterium]